MRYGFLIDNGACIGCHACSSACKSENQVPVGVQRTWVKVTEAGRYPDVIRRFQVNRCNHCDNAPCVRICPVTAMVKRPDGIVEFDSDACIGCKGCLQACPYDAIYIDPESHTAAKCHFCAHRVDIGLEPACVVVCPEHAILAGDIEDPSSEIARRLAKEPVTVRRPDQGTGPNVFYVQGGMLALDPSAAAASERFAFSDRPAHHDELPVAEAAPNAQVQGFPNGGQLVLGGPATAQRVVYDAEHPPHWHWPIPTYLITKHIAGGVFGFLSLCALTSIPFDPLVALTAGAVALVTLGITLALLVVDLDRPDRFLSLLTRPQWGSWIARAAWILTGFSALAGAWYFVELVSWMGLGGASFFRPIFATLMLPTSVLAVVYTAFLFGQAEGRDLWQGRHLPWLLAAQAAALGCGAVVGCDAFFDLDLRVVAMARTGFGVSLVIAAVGVVLSDLLMPASTPTAAAALREITHGRYRWYLRGSLLVGHLAPLLLLWTGSPVMGLVAFNAAVAGLFLYAWAFVMAPQQIPNS